MSGKRSLVSKVLADIASQIHILEQTRDMLLKHVADKPARKPRTKREPKAEAQ